MERSERGKVYSVPYLKRKVDPRRFTLFFFSVNRLHLVVSNFYDFGTSSLFLSNHYLSVTAQEDEWTRSKGFRFWKMEGSGWMGMVLYSSEEVELGVAHRARRDHFLTLFYFKQTDYV